MCIWDFITKIRRIKKVYKNWLSAATSIIFRRNQVYVILKNDIKIRLPVSAVIGLILLTKDNKFDPFSFNKIKNCLYYKNNKINTESSESVLLSANGWKKTNNLWINPKLRIKMLDINYSMYEIFHLGDYDYFSVKNREVVDIGANIGDSAIFFILRGAKKVYAFEPIPSLYRIMLENIKLNNLENKIIPFNVAVDSRNKKIKIREDKKILEIPCYSLKTVLNFVDDPYLLKIDCEGCEFDIILNSEEVSEFEKIILEYHCNFFGFCKKKLIRKLEKLNFKCREIKRNSEKSGIIYCEKK
ncbi:MAG: FkbM family methyltransferase [Candidatus Aenigmatarchaeota archaeon]